MTATPLALLGAALLGGSLVMWFRMLSRVALAGRRWIPLSAIGAAVLLALAAFTQGPGLLAGILAGITTLAGAGFLLLFVLAPQSKQTPAVAVGEHLPDITAPDENGEPFSLSSLAGRPVLLKLFRGHW